MRFMEWRKLTNEEAITISKKVDIGVKLVSLLIYFWILGGIIWAIYYIYLEIKIVLGIVDGAFIFPIFVLFIIYLLFIKLPYNILKEVQKNNKVDYLVCETVVIDRYPNYATIDHNKPGNIPDRDIVVVNLPDMQGKIKEYKISIRHYKKLEIGDKVLVASRSYIITRKFIYTLIGKRNIKLIY